MFWGLFLLFLNQFSFGGGFSRGASFQQVRLEGYLRVQCPDSVIETHCGDTFLNPWPYDVFIGPQKAEIISLRLRAFSAENEPREIESVYDGRSGRSEEINLGVSSIFQRPLLRLGQNRIEFTLRNRQGRIVEQGTFEVTVQRGAIRNCGPREIHSNYRNDCGLPYSFCQQYFKEQKYCQQ